MSIRKKTIFYDPETGETQKEYDVAISEFAVSFKVGSSKYGKSSRFSKVFQMEDPNFETPSYYQYFFKCLLHLEMYTNRLVNFTADWENMNRPLNENDLTKLFKTSKRTVYNFIAYCKNNDIIAKISKNDKLYGYVVNPKYALNGNKITPMLYTLFADEEFDKHIPKNELLKLKEYLNTKCEADFIRLN